MCLQIKVTFPPVNNNKLTGSLKLFILRHLVKSLTRITTDGTPEVQKPIKGDELTPTLITEREAVILRCFRCPTMKTLSHLESSCTESRTPIRDRDEVETPFVRKYNISRDICPNVPFLDHRSRFLVPLGLRTVVGVLT